MTQEFYTIDVLSLQVGTEWTGLPNLVPNPRGELGSWGWVGVVVDDDQTFLLDQDGGGVVIDVTEAVAGTDWLPTAADPTAPDPAFGTYAEAVITEVNGSGTVELGIRFYKRSGDVESTHWLDSTTTPGTLAGFVASTGVGDQRIYWSILIRVTSAVAGSASARFDDVIGVSALNDDPRWSDPIEVERPYVEVLGAARSVTTERIPMDVAVLTVNLTQLLSETNPTNDPDVFLIDPAKSPLLRRGKPIRLRANVEDATLGTRRHLFRGQISDVTAVYDVVPAEPRVNVTLAAVDPLSILAGVTRPNGADDLAALPELVLIGTGVPFDVAGVGAGGIMPTGNTPVAVQPEATAVDQIVITRDSNRAYAWADAAGILMVRSADDLPAVVSGTFDEEFYNGGGPTIGYDLGELINNLTIRFRYIDEADATVEVTLGPFEDLVSIREHGRSARKELAIQGVYDDWLPADLEDLEAVLASPLGAYASEVLAANGTPERRLTAVTAAIATRADLYAAGAAHHDLYELVDAASPQAGIEQESRIVRVAHSITPDKWLVTYGLAATQRIARPRAVAPIRS